MLYAHLESQLQGAIDKVDRKLFSEYLRIILLDVPYEFGQRPLHLAAERGEDHVFKSLVQELPEREELRQMTLNAKCNAGQTALHRASWEGSVAIVKILLEKGADARIQDENGNTALHFAAEKGFGSISNILIDECTAHEKNLNGITPLHFAAWSGLEKVVKRLIKTGADCKAEDKYGWVPLHYAAAAGQHTIVKLLRRQNANISMRDKKVGWTPLHFATINKHRPVIRELCKKGAELVGDDYGWSPKMFGIIKDPNLFHWARFQDRDLGKINVPTSLHCAALSEQQVSPKLLLDQEFNEAFNKDGSRLSKDQHEHCWSALGWAAKTGHLEFAKWLLSNSSYDLRASALYLAARNGAASIVELLLDKKQYIVDAAYCEPSNALFSAAENGHEAVVELLVANCENVRSYCASALSVAAENDHLEVMKLLGETVWVSNDEWLAGVIKAANQGKFAGLRWLLKLEKWDPEDVTMRVVQSSDAVVVDWLYDWMAVEFKAPHTICHRLMMNFATLGLLTELEVLVRLSKERGLWSRDWKWTILAALEVRQVEIVEYLLGLGIDQVKFNVKCKTIRQANETSLAEMVRVVITILGEADIIEDSWCKEVLEEPYFGDGPVARGLLEWMILNFDIECCKSALKPLIGRRSDYETVLEWIHKAKTYTRDGHRFVLGDDGLKENLDNVFED